MLQLINHQVALRNSHSNIIQINFSGKTCTRTCVNFSPLRRKRCLLQNQNVTSFLLQSADLCLFFQFQVIESKGPTNTRVYTVAVYFKGDRLAKAEGSSIQTAEMNAAKLALDTCSHLFPHLDYQKKIVERSLKKNKDHLKESWEEEVRKKRKILGNYAINFFICSLHS